MRRLAIVAALLTTLAAAAGAVGARTATERSACPQPRAGAAYTRNVYRALRARRDLWGNELISRRDGPSYAAVTRYLEPLLFARGRRGKPLTASGVYYLPFAQPLGVTGAASVALHVADGSQVIAQAADGARLTVHVGRHGGERYGSCLARLTPARLAGGYLPVLQTQYRDAAGVRYRQESFAIRGLRTGELVSFIRLTADAPANAAARIRLAPSIRGLALEGEGRLGREGTRLVFSAGGRFDGRSVRYEVPAGGSLTVYAGWFVRPVSVLPLPIDAAVYDEARARLATFWQRRLAEGASFSVPDAKVMDARRSLLIQNLALTWRYSIGNPYEQFSFAEAMDVAQVMGAFGFRHVPRVILRNGVSLVRNMQPNWRKGAKLFATAQYYRLLDDADYVAEVTPALSRFVESLARQLDRKASRGLLRRERYSNDIAAQVYGLHTQAVVWQGLRAMSGVWAETGRPDLARKSARLARRLGAGLRRAVRSSSRSLHDRSLFVPVALLAGHKPFDPIAASRPGSYWNLVMPYALASGLFPPNSRQARGILDYMLEHGSRLLGLVRARAYPLYRGARYPVSGIDQVYGLNMARFLADNDRPDQLVLSLYGMLGAAMTPNTFVSGEAATIAPLKGARYRTMYLPPNGASNAAFLETLRLMLVHETRDANGAPVGLELAFSTPRPWLGRGKSIGVADVPTSFGLLSYRVRSLDGRVEASVSLIRRREVRSLKLRLRLPHGSRIAGVTVDGRPHRRFDRRTGTIDLTGLTGTIELVARVR